MKASYGLLSAVYSKWKISTLDTEKASTNWVDVHKNLSNRALYKVIVKDKFQSTKTKN